MRFVRTIQPAVPVVFEGRAMHAVRRAITATHGADFAAAFLRDHRRAVRWAVTSHLKGCYINTATGMPR